MIGNPSLTQIGITALGDYRKDKFKIALKSGAEVISLTVNQETTTGNFLVISNISKELNSTKFMIELNGKTTELELAKNFILSNYDSKNCIGSFTLICASDMRFEYETNCHSSHYSHYSGLR